MTKGYIGIDFGTTNTVLSVLDDDGHVRTATYHWPSGVSETFRTVLCFWAEDRQTHTAAAQDAITEYLKDTAESRFIQSMKTYLGSATFSETRIFGQRYALEDLIALFLKHLWNRARVDLNLTDNPADYTVVSGRPVAFAGAEPDESLAVKRLAEAYARAGFKNVTFAYEPEGAAFWYARSLQQDACVLVADFGGGTSDFSIVDCVREGDKTTIIPRAHTGVGIAGDRLDFQIIDHLIAPDLGKGSTYQSFGKTMDMPIGYYRSFASWHLLSMLKTPKIIKEIEEIARTSSAPDQLDHLATMIRDEMGYLLYQSVGAAKAALSSAEETVFDFNSNGVVIRKKLKRDQFNKWIAADIARMRASVDSVLHKAGKTPDDITTVFMTGGTSFVGAVRTMITDYFGADKLADGGEFTSVGAGLALIARERHAAK